MYTYLLVFWQQHISLVCVLNVVIALSCGRQRVQLTFMRRPLNI